MKLGAAYLGFCSNFKIEPKIANKQQYHATLQVSATVISYKNTENTYM